MKSDLLKRDLPRRDGVELKKSKLAEEEDRKWFLIGLGGVMVAGIIKTLIMDRFGPPE